MGHRPSLGDGIIRTLKMKAVTCYEMSATVCKSTQHRITEDLSTAVATAGLLLSARYGIRRLTLLWSQYPVTGPCSKPDELGYGPKYQLLPS
jgi:hypothetical protein